MSAEPEPRPKTSPASNPRSRRVWFDRDVLTSPATLKMRGSAWTIYLHFCSRLKVLKLKRADSRGEQFRNVNNGELILTYRDAKRLYGISTSSFRDAIDYLIKHGLIDVTHAGGGLEGDTSTYALSERWRLYGTPAFQPMHREKRTPRIGLQIHGNALRLLTALPFPEGGTSGHS